MYLVLINQADQDTLVNLRYMKSGQDGADAGTMS